MFTYLLDPDSTKASLYYLEKNIRILPFESFFRRKCDKSFGKTGVRKRSHTYQQSRLGVQLCRRLVCQLRKYSSRAIKKPGCFRTPTVMPVMRMLTYRRGVPGCQMAGERVNGHRSC